MRSRVPEGRFDLVTLTYNNRRINTSFDKLSDDQETMQTIIDNIPRAVFGKERI